MKKGIKRTALALTSAMLTMAAAAQAPIEVKWEMGKNNAEPGYYSSKFIIKNVGNAILGNNWKFYFNQFSRSFKLPANCRVEMKEVSTTYYEITPRATSKPLAPGDTIVVNMLMRGTMVNSCYTPSGGHVVLNGNPANPRAVEIKKNELSKPGQWIDHAAYPDGNYMYAFNESINSIGDAYTGNDYDIFPTPKKVVLSNGVTHIGNIVTIKANAWYKSNILSKWFKKNKKASALFKESAAAELLKEELRRRGIYETNKQETVIEIRIVKDFNENPEYYSLEVYNGNITITAGTEEGAVNGVKTLVAAIDHSKGRNLQNAVITDYPDLHYRGFMMDIARNFYSFKDIKRYIDQLSYYKINRLQFHFADDEAWRVEIPGLPELTQVGARRGCTLDEKDFLAQIFDGNGNPDDKRQSANGYLTRAEMVDLLKYAALRGIKVIPEIETPGHARAAIVAMKSRYNKLAGTDIAQAEQYKLWDDDNTSVYTSAQSYHDNVLNVAGDGVYNFIDKVVTELELMYKDAGLVLDVVHLGGDEVASGAWDKSPAVQSLMARENLKNAHQVNEYFITRVSDMLYPRGILIEGWQEVALDHSAEWNAKMAPRFAGVNAWSTIGKKDVVPYTLANDGYPVILSNVTNFYMDMAYSWHQYDQGLHWGGKVDEFDSWSALPWNVYASARTAYDGSAIDVVANSQDKVQLNKRANVIGVQAQLWGETLRNFDQVQYLTIPKIFGVVERAWNATPEWSKDLGDKKAYEAARRQYNLRIGAVELPLMKAKGYNFRVGMPGIKIEGGKLMANAQYPGTVIRYTLDGSEPTHESAMWTAPVKVSKYTVIKAKAFYLGKESLTTYLFKK